MMHRLLLLLLALGLWQIACTQVHCGLEPLDCQEGACELCHLADISALPPVFSQLRCPPPTPRPAVLPRQGATFRPFSRHNRGRAPPC